jgi:hypothetical protein
MGDVYVEAGEVKGKIDKKFVPQAQDGLKKAIAAAARKANSGMTTVKPGGGKGIRVNIMVFKLEQDGANVTCTVVGDLLELPSKERFTTGGTPRGQGTVPGKIDAVAGDCVGKAVGDLMDNIGSAIVGSQAAPAATGTAASKSPLIYIAPADVSYPQDAKDADQNVKDKAKAAIIDAMQKTFGKNPKRFTLDSSAFKQGSGMPAYVLHIRVEKFVFDPKTKEMIATVKALIHDYPGDSMQVPSVAATSKGSGYTGAPREADKLQVVRDAAQGMTEKAINDFFLKKHP